MQKFAIAIGLLLSLLFLTGSGVSAEAATLWRQTGPDKALHTADNADGIPESAGIYNPKAS